MPDTPQIGSVVTLKELSNEKFVIGKILCGGMGEVYQLIPVAPVGPVLALKTYQQTATREQFIREADLWISLGNHAYIARALMYLEWQSRPSIIANWYKQPIDCDVVRAWPTEQIVNFAGGLIDGLEYALNVGGIIHQDVKPANILLDEKDEPRLTDFGMARFADRGLAIGSLEGVDASMVNSVSLGPIGGTPFYMAPELFAGQPPSVRTDIFSLGITRYQIVTGEHPYCGPETGHRLRPSFRSGPLRRLQSVDIRSLQVMLGHKNIATTEKYLKSLRLDQLRDKIESSALAAYL